MINISRIGLRISAVFQRIVPDPFVIAILLTLFTAVLALTLGRFELTEGGTRLTALLDAWRSSDGLWKFLAFGMQMCLVLVTGHALAEARPIRRIINALARVPHSTASAAALVATIACLAAILNWGLGLIVGAILAREVGRSLESRGIAAHYPLICAAGYMGLLVWHGGFSGSAPLAMTSFEGAAKVIPAQYLQNLDDAGVPLTETILSTRNIIVTGGLLVIAPCVLAILAPRRREEMTTISAFAHDTSQSSDLQPEACGTHTFPDRLDTSAIVAWLLALGLLAAFLRYGYVVGNASAEAGMLRQTGATLRGFARLGLDEVNIFMIALGLILHASPRSYMQSISEGARGCGAIILQFPLYAGIMAMMVEAGLIERIAAWLNTIGNETTIPCLSFLSAGVVNLLVPSGGGQWGIQGPVALETGFAAGIEPGRMIMSVAYGDQLTNMLQPFWALPLLAITGVRARDIVGYTAIVMVIAAVWILLCLLLF
ncbi:MAG: short-chain fatty acid transporter [Phycisphaerales bacterium]